MDTSDITADDIAEMTFAAMTQKELFLLPHKLAQIANDIKKQQPEKHYEEMIKISVSNKRKKEAAT